LSGATNFAASNSVSESKIKTKPVSENKYSKTVSLPQSSFEQRANAVKKEPEIQKWWKEMGVYEKLSKSNPGDVFVLHDGPPYANGDLHIGHALNKILKDFVNRYNILQGKKVRFVPGWDCHGLPIEMKVLQSLKSKERENLTPLALRKIAAEYATVTMNKQRDSFKRYGVWGDWEDPYLTLQPQYEAAQIRVFGEMVRNGHIYRGKKPVHWSPSSQTALAEAELEYPENHISRSIYVGFKVVQMPANVTAALKGASDVRVAIWTTTPWTIPANLAVAVNENLRYSAITHPAVMNGAHFIVAEELISSFSAKCGLESTDSFSIIASFSGKDLEGTSYQHPLYDRKSEIVVGGDYITTESGTGLVHTAPGHGVEDYHTGLKYGLPLLSPVDDKGKFTNEAGPRFEGKDVLTDGNMEVIAALNECGVLIKEEPYNHKYPYDWRTKKPTIFRATEQWFASVTNFKDEALKAIDTVQWIPYAGRNRIASMIEGRGDWCISRQRSWGVPIPVFYRIDNNEPLMTQETLNNLEKIFEKHGSNAWWEMSVEELLPPSLQHLAGQYTKGFDTMDVWFDSGTSWAGVVKSRDSLSYPADMYLEGSDQSRGWFQSSLLTSVATQGVAPYKTVLTHGFVLDEKGSKMSKSLGNVVDPLIIIQGGPNQKENPPYGADTLRMWVSGVDYSGDVCIGTNIMRQVSDSYRKMRNTIRFLLGSLNDFDPAQHQVQYNDLPEMDKYILGSLSRVMKEVEKAYNEHQFNRINHLLGQFASSDLSAFYLDISKDRLYISSKDNWRRRSCQTTIDIISRQVMTMLAPILPHLAEEAWRSLPYTRSVGSIFENGWVKKNEIFPEHDELWWNLLKKIRLDTNKCIELARQAKQVGASMESAVFIYSKDENIKKRLSDIKGDTKLLSDFESTNSVDDLRFVLMVSQVHVVENESDILRMEGGFVVRTEESESSLTIGIRKASGKKCERCWFYSGSVGDDHVHSDICSRCVTEIRTDGHEV
jgi:isoleucyl-tRNA synthetase